MAINDRTQNGHNGVTTTTVATIQGHKDQLYVLLDTGCSNTIVSNKYLNYLESVKKIKTNYATAGGPYKTGQNNSCEYCFLVLSRY